MNISEILKIYKQKIYKMEHLPEKDKKILLSALDINYETANALLPTLSIFTKNYKQERFEDYSYLTLDQDELYYSGFYNHLGIFFNKNKEIVFGSRYFLSHLNSFIDHIDSCLNLLKKINIDNVKDIGSDFISIEKWFFSYGHFHDELFTLSYISSNFPLSVGYRFLLDYPDDEHRDGSNFKHNKNYFELEKMVFKGNSLNLYRYGSEIIKIKKLIIFRNAFNSNTFHKFPLPVVDYLTSQIKIVASSYGERIFLTRGLSYRDIANKEEVEKYYIEIGYRVINPEEVSIGQLIYTLQQAKNLVLYWGSGMTSLVYLRTGATVTIIKSASYENETLTLWKNLLENRNFELTVIESSFNSVKMRNLS